MRSFSDATEPIEVEVGEEFALRLRSTPTTGFRWSITGPMPAEGVVQVVAEELEAPGSSPGAGGAQVFRLRAVGAGSTEVGLRRHRSWEATAGPGPDAVFGVIVR